MMPTYKLMYFDTKGRAEVIRILLTAAGQEFEDVRFKTDRVEWEKVKPTLPQKQMPLLQVDDRYIPQSGAILRYIARTFGLYGANDDESTTIDIVHGVMGDFFQNIFDTFYAKDEAKKAELMKDLVENKFGHYMNILEDILKENKGGDEFFVGDKISLADIVVFDLFDQVTAMATLPAFPPKLGALMERVRTYPKIKEYLAKRK